VESGSGEAGGLELKCWLQLSILIPREIGSSCIINIVFKFKFSLYLVQVAMATSLALASWECSKCFHAYCTDCVITMNVSNNWSFCTVSRPIPLHRRQFCRNTNCSQLDSLHFICQSYLTCDETIEQLQTSDSDGDDMMAEEFDFIDEPNDSDISISISENGTCDFPFSENGTCDFPFSENEKIEFSSSENAVLPTDFITDINVLERAYEPFALSPLPQLFGVYEYDFDEQCDDYWARYHWI